VGKVEESHTANELQQFFLILLSLSKQKKKKNPMLNLIQKINKYFLFFLWGRNEFRILCFFIFLFDDCIVLLSNFSSNVSKGRKTNVISND